MNFEKNIAFEHACRLRPISAFHPEVLLENNLDEYRRFLSADSKLLWFYTYCMEQGLKGSVNTEFVSGQTLAQIPSSEVAGGAEFLYKEYWRATVYINGEEVGSAQASGTFAANDHNERDTASGQLRKGAIGAALSQAGFGVISSYAMSENDKAQLQAMGAGNGMPSGEQPVIQNPFVFEAPQTMNSPAAPTQNFPGQSSLFGGSVPTAPTFTPPSPVMQQPQFIQPATVQEDPLVAAKQVRWTGGGPNKDKTLGEILSERGVNGIKYYAEFTPRNEAGHRIKAAAQLILASLQTGA